MTELYNQDYWTWTKRQAEALRRRSGNELDWDRLAQELESLGANEERELQACFVVLLAHLLKWSYQPERRSRSWENTIANQRDEIADHLARNPGLKSAEDDLFARAYVLARREASTETDLDVTVFPQEPPFALAQAKDLAWMPEEAGG